MRLVLDEVEYFRLIRHPGEALKEKWNHFVRNHPEGNFFQSPAAHEFYSGTREFTPYIFVAFKNEEIIGVLQAVLIRGKGPKGFFSRRCVVWGGPLVLNNDKVTTSKLISKLNSTIAHLSIFTEFRNLFDTKLISDAFFNNNFHYEDEVNFLVEITQEVNPLQNINESKRRQIKKSFKNGASIIEAQNINQVREYYKILFTLYKEKVKKPLPDLHFFEHFFTYKEYGKILLVMFEDKVVGGITCPIFEDRIYELYVCGQDKDYKNIYPSVLATWAAIYYAWSSGLTTFDFMGAGKPDEYYGVRQFKSQFGGKFVRYGRYRRINQKLMYKVGKIGLAINQMLT